MREQKGKLKRFPWNSLQGLGMRQELGTLEGDWLFQDSKQELNLSEKFLWREQRYLFWEQAVEQRPVVSLGRDFSLCKARSECR